MYIPCTHKLYRLNPFNHRLVHVKVVMHVSKLSTDVQRLVVDWKRLVVDWKRLKVLHYRYRPFNVCCVLCSPGEVLGLVTDCDLLSANTTSTTHIILISTDEMWTHITQHHNIQYSWYTTCVYTYTYMKLHTCTSILPSHSLLPPTTPSHYTHHHDVDAWLSRATASTRCKNIIL